ncbi:Ribonuclease [compost metagenome]
MPCKAWFTLHDTQSLVCRIRLQRAGHIFDSAYLEVDLHYPQSGEKKRMVFSGDLGAPHAPLLPAPKPPYRADILVIESTYGEGRCTRRQRLERVVEQALADNGTVLIPAFSIGRTQGQLYELEDIIHRKKLNTSRLAETPFWDNEAPQRAKQGRNPLGFQQLLIVDSHQANLAMVRHLTETASSGHHHRWERYV